MIKIDYVPSDNTKEYHDLSGIQMSLKWQVIDLGTQSSIMSDNRRLQSNDLWNQIHIKMEFSDPLAVSGYEDTDQIDIKISDKILNEINQGM